MVEQKERAPERLRGLRAVIAVYEAWDQPEEAARYRALLPDRSLAASGES
jgi:hypothetical protein